MMMVVVCKSCLIGFVVVVQGDGFEGSERIFGDRRS